MKKLNKKKSNQSIEFQEKDVPNETSDRLSSPQAT
jgi:hypothetical protein